MPNIDRTSPDKLDSLQPEDHRPVSLFENTFRHNVWWNLIVAKSQTCQICSSSIFKVVWVFNTQYREMLWWSGLWNIKTDPFFMKWHIFLISWLVSFGTRLILAGGIPTYVWLMLDLGCQDRQEIREKWHQTENNSMIMLCVCVCVCVGGGGCSKMTSGINDYFAYLVCFFDFGYPYPKLERSGAAAAPWKFEPEGVIACHI